MEPKFFEPEGFDIPGRDLTPEEQDRPITKERFHEWMCEVGEDYVDQISMTKQANLLFMGFLLHKHPSRAVEILRVANSSSFDTLKIQHEVYENATEEEQKPLTAGYATKPEAWEIFYTDLAEFINLTQGLKARTNANLILVMEHYNQ